MEPPDLPQSESPTLDGVTFDAARAMFDIAMESAEEEAKATQIRAAGGTGFFYLIDLTEQRKSIVPIPSPK